MNISELCFSIDKLLLTKEQIIIAVDGNSGSGKTTLAELLQNHYDCNIFHMDHFFLTPELRTKERLEEAGGNVDYIRFREEVLKGIKQRNVFKYKIFNCKSQSFEESDLVKPKKLNIVEGSYSMHPVLASFYDLKIFLEINEQTQKSRILKRNGELLYKRFFEGWIPIENNYFNKLNIKAKCDIVISVHGDGSRAP